MRRDNIRFETNRLLIFGKTGQLLFVGETRSDSFGSVCLRCNSVKMKNSIGTSSLFDSTRTS